MSKDTFTTILVARVVFGAWDKTGKVDIKMSAKYKLECQKIISGQKLAAKFVFVQ